MFFSIYDSVYNLIGEAGGKFILINDLFASMAFCFAFVLCFLCVCLPLRCIFKFVFGGD